MNNNAKLVTIYTEAALENRLIEDIENHGAVGYTISNAKGKGSSGSRTASWEANANIRVEIICNAALAHSLAEHLQETYYDHYAMVIFLSDVEVLRSQKFNAE